MEIVTIRRLLEPCIELDEQRLSAISKYIDVLVKWNARINLTAVRAPEEMIQRHFGESFFAARHLLSGGLIKSLIDLGSGAGFPGVPFALLDSNAEVTLIESNQKKATFLRELVRTLGLTNVEVFSDRGEKYSKQAELVTLRAVEKFSNALCLAAKLVKPGGRVAAMIGDSQVVYARELQPDLEWREAVLVPGGHSRVLLVGTQRVKVE